MLTVLIAVLVVSAIGAGLAAVLVAAERRLMNYGPCRIDINEGEREFTTDGGGHLLQALVQEKLFIPSACGGRGTCGFCKVKVLEGAGLLLPTEEPFLEKEEREENVRLSCQVKVRQDMRIEIPEELLSVQEFRARCGEIEQLTHDMVLLRFELIEPETIKFVPGQYVQLLAPRYPGNKEEVYRAYSIASDPAVRDAIELIIRRVPGGTCTTYVFEHLGEGDEVMLNGPYGEFRLSETDAPVLFVAGGSGIAPIKCLLHQMVNEGIERPARFYFGANLVKELCLLDLMREFEEKLADFTFVPVVMQPEAGAEWQGATGLVTEALERDMPKAAGHEAYLCGSPGMIDASIKVLQRLGVREEDIYYDKFA